MTSDKLNHSVTRMIISWLNHLNLLNNQQVTSLKDLTDGQVLSQLARFVIDIKYKLVVNTYDLHEINERFEFIKYLIENQFDIKTGILYAEAKECNEFELAKIALILLINGLVSKSEPITIAANKLPHNQYELINIYFYLYEKEHDESMLSSANLSMCLIEKFLCLTGQNRKLLGKELSNSAFHGSNQQFNNVKKTDKSSKIDSIDTDPKEVQIRLIFLRVGDIDTLNEKFFAEILVEAKWEEPRLEEEFVKTADPSKLYEKEEREFQGGNKYWNPQIFVDNVLNEPKQHVHFKIKKELIQTPIKVFLTDENSNRVHKRKNVAVIGDSCSVDSSSSKSSLMPTFSYWLYEYRKIRGYFFAKLELNFFPLDTQDLSIIITTFKSNKHVKLIQNTTKPSLINSKTIIDQNIWHLYHHIEVKSNYESNSKYDEQLLLFDNQNQTFNDKSVPLQDSDNSPSKQNNLIDDLKRNGLKIMERTYISAKKLLKIEEIRYPVLTFHCKAARRSGYFFWNAFLLIFLITSAVFTTFTIDIDKPYFRLPISATLLLTSITFRWGYSTRCLPTINYLTSLDKYSIGSIIVIYLALLWHGMCAMLIKPIGLHYMITVDLFVMTMFGLFYLLFHVILLIWLNSAFSIRRCLNKRDEKYFKSRFKSQQNNLNISQDNIVEEAAEKNGDMHITMNNLGNSDIDKSVKQQHRGSRRFSSQFKSVISNINRSQLFNSSNFS